MTHNPPAVAVPPLTGYRSLLGEAAWQRLHPAIQQRFCSNACRRAVTYRGVMQEVWLSASGKLLAHCCRIIGTPLALYSGSHIPTDVDVYYNPKLRGMTWDRYYRYPDRPVNRVKSTKCISHRDGLIEVVGCGFGMQLRLFEQRGALYFESTRFFWQLGRLRIPLPDWLTPGKTRVCQRALDNLRFEFSLTVTHRWLGPVFRQRGIFRDTIAPTAALS